MDDHDRVELTEGPTPGFRGLYIGSAEGAPSSREGGRSHAALMKIADQLAKIALEGDGSTAYLSEGHPEP